MKTGRFFLFWQIKERKSTAPGSLSAAVDCAKNFFAVGQAFFGALHPVITTFGRTKGKPRTAKKGGQLFDLFGVLLFFDVVELCGSAEEGRKLEAFVFAGSITDASHVRQGYCRKNTDDSYNYHQLDQGKT